MRKVKVSGEVTIMDVSAAPLGVYTRARTLALQRLQKQQEQGEEGAGGEYLELRGRRLKKLPPLPSAKRRKVASAAAVTKEEVEASQGENMLELEAMDRSTRETTPCNSIIPQMITPSTPRRKTRSSRSSHRMVKSRRVHAVPISSREMKEFFDAEERRHQQAFIDKYNFDPVNECPLPGKYEWVKLK